MTMSVALLSDLEARGLDVELATRLGWDGTSRDGIDYLAIPCLRDGRIHRRKYRSLGAAKRFFQEGEGPIPWNEDCLRNPELHGLPLIITEGELDALTAIQCGFPRTISVPDGAPQSPTEGAAVQRRYEWISELRGLLTRELAPVIILATDGDGPGAALLQDLSILLGRFRCQFLIYPKRPGAADRLKDLNEVLQAYGAKGVVETIGRAAWLQVDGVFRMAQLPELPPIQPLCAGFPLLDENYRVRRGDLAVVTGIPSHGKSAFVNDFFCRLATAHNLRIAWASFEQEPMRDHRRALRTWFTERAEHRQTADELARADAWIDAHHRFILPGEDDDVTIDWMVERLEQAVVQHGCKVAVIDPWNEMDHMRERDETETEYTGRCIKRLKRVAKAFDVHIAIVAHPTKLRRDDKGITPMPNLYDINGSAAWNNKCDVGVIVHRMNAEDTVVQVAKSRYHTQIGAPGKVRMQFCKDDLRYREMERL